MQRVKCFPFKNPYKAMIIIFALWAFLFDADFCDLGWADSGKVCLRPLAAKDKGNKKKSLWEISAGSSRGLPLPTEDLYQEADKQAHRSWRAEVEPHPAREENMQEVAEFIGWYTDNNKGPIDKSVKIDELYVLFELHSGSFRRSAVRRIEGHEVIEDVFFTTLCDLFGRTYMISPTKELREDISVNRIVMHFLEGYVVNDPRRLNAPQEIGVLYKKFKTAFWCHEFSESAFLRLLDSMLPPGYLLDRETRRPRIEKIMLSRIPIRRSLSIVLEQAGDTETEGPEGSMLVLNDEEIGARGIKVRVIAKILHKYGPYIPSGQTARNAIAYVLSDLPPDISPEGIQQQAIKVRSSLQLPRGAKPEGEDLGVVAASMLRETLEEFNASPIAPPAKPEPADIEPPGPDPLTAI
jgi:hypothetical protein